MHISLKLIYEIRKAYMLQPIQMAASVPRKALEKKEEAYLSLIL